MKYQTGCVRRIRIVVVWSKSDPFWGLRTAQFSVFADFKFCKQIGGDWRRRGWRFLSALVLLFPVLFSASLHGQSSRWFTEISSIDLSLESRFRFDRRLLMYDSMCLLVENLFFNWGKFRKGIRGEHGMAVLESTLVWVPDRALPFEELVPRSDLERK